jgi:hypothetical protein
MSKRLPTEIDATALLQWEFRRGNQSLTCAISAWGEDAYTVMTLPHDGMDRGAMETFAEPRAALQRHALIASRLRDSGWSVTSYTH